MSRIVLSLATLAVALLIVTGAAFAQTSTPSNLAAVGVSYQPGASPAVAGTGLYARLLSTTTNTWAFTALDALPATIKPFTVTTDTAVGVAQKVVTINGVDIYIPTAAGISWTGQNTGWNWSTGGLAVVKLGSSSWRLLPNVRVVKNSVGGQGYGVIAGVLVGWNW